MLNVCLICSPLLIVEVIFVITLSFLFLSCASTILVNKDDHNTSHVTLFVVYVIFTFECNSVQQQKTIAVMELWAYNTI